MVKTRRKNYISFSETSEQTDIPLLLVDKKPLLEVSYKTKLLDLSNDIILNILSNLTLDSLENMRLVTQRMNTLGIIELKRRSREIIRRYQRFVKFSPSNLHPDVDACCVLQNLCQLEEDIKEHDNTNEIIFPRRILDEATNLLSLMSRNMPEDVTIKGDRLKNLVLLIYKLRCTYCKPIPRDSPSRDNLLTPTFNSNNNTIVKKHTPITYP